MSYLNQIINNMSDCDKNKILLDVIGNEEGKRLEIVRICFMEVLPLIPKVNNGGNVIGAIKAFRAVSGLGLKESKEFVEKYIGTALVNSSPFDNISRT